jgi:hypothetical protein
MGFAQSIKFNALFNGSILRIVHPSQQQFLENVYYPPKKDTLYPQTVFPHPPHPITLLEQGDH